MCTIKWRQPGPKNSHNLKRGSRCTHLRCRKRLSSPVFWAFSGAWRHPFSLRLIMEQFVDLIVKVCAHNISTKHAQLWVQIKRVENKKEKQPKNKRKLKWRTTYSLLLYGNQTYFRTILDFIFIINCKRLLKQWSVLHFSYNNKPKLSLESKPKQTNPTPKRRLSKCRH